MKKIPYRVLETRQCAWCSVGAVHVTTQQRVSERHKRRFCSLDCARRASGITHGEDWGRKMQIASAAAVKRKALVEAEAMLRRYPPDVAARLIRERGYKAGYKAGQLAGVTMERARSYREARRQELARKRGEVAA